MDCLRSCHSISIRFKSGLWFGHSKTLILFSLSHSEVDLLVCWDHCPAAEPKCAWAWGHNWRLDILLQDFLIECRIHGSINYDKSSRSWSCKAAQDHHTTTTMFDCWYDVLFMKCCVEFTPDVTGHTPSKKFNFCRISPQKICPKYSRSINQDIFWQVWDEPLCSLWSAMTFPWNSPMDAVFAQSLSYCWFMNTDLNWGKWGLQFFRCCSGFFYDLLDESSLRSWSNFGRSATPGRFITVLSFVDNGSDCGSLESQSLRNAL